MTALVSKRLVVLMPPEEKAQLLDGEVERLAVPPRRDDPSEQS